MSPLRHLTRIIVTLTLLTSAFLLSTPATTPASAATPTSKVVWTHPVKATINGSTVRRCKTPSTRVRITTTRVLPITVKKKITRKTVRPGTLLCRTIIKTAPAPVTTVPTPTVSATPYIPATAITVQTATCRQVTDDSWVVTATWRITGGQFWLRSNDGTGIYARPGTTVTLTQTTTIRVVGDSPVTGGVGLPLVGERYRISDVPLLGTPAWDGWSDRSPIFGYAPTC
jgi:hypothetical protein